MKRFLLIIILLLSAADLFYSQIGGYALQFDGTDDYAARADGPLGGATNLTIEAWIYIDENASGEMSLVQQREPGVGGSRDQYILKINSDLSLDFWDYGNSYGFLDEMNSGVILSKGTWTHIAVSKDGESASYYVNGKLGRTEARSGSAVSYNSALDFYIGQDGRDFNKPFNGKLDEVRIWNDARTEAEINSYMYKELVGNEANLVAYYKMSNGSGTTLSDNQTSGMYDLSIANGATWKTSGAFAGSRQALDFDGTDDYVAFASSPVYNNDAVTIEAWINSTSANVEEVIVSWGSDAGLNDNVQLRMQEGKLQFGADVAGWTYVIGNTSINTGSWVHVAMVKNGTSVSLYVNGQLDASGTMDKNPNVPNFFVGETYKNGSLQGYYFPGKIDEVRIWNTVRSESQIRDNMMTTLTGTEADLAAYYRFDQYAGTTLYDITANGYNGTLTNMDAATDWVSSSAFNTWIGSESSDWTTAANWSSGSAPAATDNVGLYKWDLGNEANISGTPTINSILFSSIAVPAINSDFNADGTIILEKDVNISGNNISLGEKGYLSEGIYRLYGTTGTISTTRNLESITEQNIAGLGAVLTGGGNRICTVSGAGTAAVNGEYSFSNIENGKNSYTKGIYKIYYDGWNWHIRDNESNWYYYNSNPGTINPPTDGWESDFMLSGAVPAPTLSLSSDPVFGNTTITRGHTDYSSSGLTSIDRYYIIEPTTNAGLNATLSFIYNEAELNGIPEADLRLFKSDDANTWTMEGGIVSEAENKVTLGGINSFSYWTLGDVDSPLPVELSAFTASVSAGKVTLNWQTATEINNHGFEIEKMLMRGSHSDPDLSGEESQWEKIGFIAGSGNSNSPKSYSFIDKTPVASAALSYRLKQIDNDGKYSYSEEITVELSAIPTEFSLSQNYPNPFNPATTIEFSLPKEADVLLKVYNLLGQEVVTLLSGQMKAGYHKVKFDASGLSSGVYLYKIQAGDFSAVKKLMLLK